MIKLKKNASDILGFESRLKQKEDTINENERGLSFNRGFFYYLQKNHLVYECKSSSFNPTNINKITTWKSTGSLSNNMIAIKNASGDLPKLELVDDYYVQVVIIFNKLKKICLIILGLIFIAFTN